eukprot:382767-Prymnesium_polylepis.1
MSSTRRKPGAPSPLALTPRPRTLTDTTRRVRRTTTAAAPPPPPPRPGTAHPPRAHLTRSPPLHPTAVAPGARRGFTDHGSRRRGRCSRRASSRRAIAPRSGCWEGLP